MNNEKSKLKPDVLKLVALLKTPELLNDGHKDALTLAVQACGRVTLFH